MTSNRHIVDQLADCRAQIKELQEREKDLKNAVSDAMGKGDSLGGDQFVAYRTRAQKKGSIDPKLMEKKKLDPDKFRKPGSEVVTIRTEPRVMEDV